MEAETHHKFIILIYSFGYKLKMYATEIVFFDISGFKRDYSAVSYKFDLDIFLEE